MQKPLFFYFLENIPKYFHGALNGVRGTTGHVNWSQTGVFRTGRKRVRVSVCVGRGGGEKS